MNDKRSPWYWPTRALIVFIAIVLLGTALAILTGCGSPASGGGGSGIVSQKENSNGFSESTITLSDGREITCITWSEYDLVREGASGGVSCDWGASEGTEE